MLILTRRPGERIIIGDNVSVKVVRTQDCRVVIGICAPAEVAVQRKEVYERPRLPRTAEHADSGCSTGKR